MYKNLFICSLLSCLVFAQANAKESQAKVDDSKLLGEFLKEKCQDVPFLEDLSLSGKLNLAFVTSNQYLSKEVDIPSFSLDGDVYIDYKKVVDGVGFGFKIGTKARSGMIKGGSAIVDSSYVFTGTDKLGEFRFGYSKSAGSAFSISHADVLTGYNLVDSGNASSFYAQTSGSILGTGFDKDDAKALKFVWLSPTFKGWSVGFSYAPNSRDGHLFKEKRNKIEKDYDPSQNFADYQSYIKDSFTGGISYEYGDPNAFNMKIALAGWTAKGRTDAVTKLRDVKGYNIGAIFGYAKYKLALGFTDNMNSMIPRDLIDPSAQEFGMCPGANNGKLYNIGIGYFGDKWEMSAGHFHAVKKWSSNERSNTNITTVAVQYNVDKMLSTYVEYNNIRTKTCDRIMKSEEHSDGSAYGNNRANLFIVGAKINI